MSFVTAVFNSMYYKMIASNTEAAMLANSHQRLGLVNQAMKQVSFGSGLSNIQTLAAQDNNLEQQKVMYEFMYPIYKQLGASCDELVNNKVKDFKLNILV